MSTAFNNSSGYKNILSSKPEGVAGYVADNDAAPDTGHAVLLTDYMGDDFYCFNPAGNGVGRHLISSTDIKERNRNINNYRKYWSIISGGYTGTPMSPDQPIAPSNPGAPDNPSGRPDGSCCGIHYKGQYSTDTTVNVRKTPAGSINSTLPPNSIITIDTITPKDLEGVQYCWGDTGNGWVALQNCTHIPNTTGNSGNNPSVGSGGGNYVDIPSGKGTYWTNMAILGNAKTIINKAKNEGRYSSENPRVGNSNYQMAKIDNRYAIATRHAIGNHLGVGLGDYLDVEFIPRGGSKEIIPCIGVEWKGLDTDRNTGNTLDSVKNIWGHKYGECITEYINTGDSYNQAGVNNPFGDGQIVKIKNAGASGLTPGWAATSEYALKNHKVREKSDGSGNWEYYGSGDVNIPQWEIPPIKNNVPQYNEEDPVINVNGLVAEMKIDQMEKVLRHTFNVRDEKVHETLKQILEILKAKKESKPVPQQQSQALEGLFDDEIPSQLTRILT